MAFVQIPPVDACRIGSLRLALGFTLNSSALPFAHEEVRHGTVARSDGGGPEVAGAESLHAAELFAVLPQVRGLLQALPGGTGCRRGPRVPGAPDRGRTTGLCQLPSGLRRA